MKKVFFVFNLFLIISCSHQIDKENLIGLWDCTSALDMESNEISLPEGEEKFIVTITSDSIIIPETGIEKYTWKIKGDSLVITNLITVYIKELKPTALIVEYDFLGHTQLTFKKIKK